MPQIYQLPLVSSLNSGDQFALYTPNQGDTRRASIGLLLQYFQENFASPEYESFYLSPISGFVYQIGAQTKNVFLVLTPAGTLASGTVELPPIANAFDGQVVLIVSTTAITSLTIDGNGASVVGALSSMPAGGFIAVRFDNFTDTWYTVSQVTPQGGSTFPGDISIGGDILDPNGNELLGLSYVASAVNELRVLNAATGDSPELQVTGDDTNINITFVPKGSGVVQINTNAVLYNTGPLGTPASGDLTNCTNLPISTGVSGLGAGVATFLATPSSANLASAVTDETGSGLLVFNTNPTIDGANFTGHAETTPVVDSSSANTLTIDCTDSNVFTVTLTENVTTFTLDNPADGQTINVLFTQDATGSRTITWPASFVWSLGLAPTLSTAASAEDFLVATYIGTTWYASLLKAFS